MKGPVAPSWAPSGGATATARTRRSMTLTTTTVNCAGCSASCVNGFVTRARRHRIAPSAAGVDAWLEREP